MKSCYQAIGRLLTMVMLLALSSQRIFAQTQTPPDNEVLIQELEMLNDSTSTRVNGLLLGYEITLGTLRYQIESDISQLNMLPASFLGCNAGLVMGNDKGKVKASAGLYYADDRVPYSIDIFNTSLSGMLNLLHWKHSRNHLLEPYVAGGVSRQVNKFYGMYLDHVARRNYSTSNEPLLGKVAMIQLTYGAGVEHRLRCAGRSFIHLFAEVTTSHIVDVKASNTAFAGTRFSNAMAVSAGLNFGMGR